MSIRLLLPLLAAWLCLPLVPLAAQNDSASEGAVPAEEAATDTEETEAAEVDDRTLVYILRIDEPITKALLYYLRRGVKEAADAEADMLIIDMNTPGGAGDAMQEIMDLIGKFEHQDQTYTYVNDEAISAGALIAASTRYIYFAPKGIMGSAAPVMSSGQDIPETLMLKVNSYMRAKLREVAERNGHRPSVFEAMIDSKYELKIGDEIIKPKDELLTLTASEALKEYGDPPEPLLSAGTVETVDALVEKVAGADARVVKFEPTGYEQVATYITYVAPILFSLGLVLGYLEFQTPGFGFFGGAAIVCLAIFFFGHYIAGLSSADESMIALLVFFLGALLIAVEIFLIPGTLLAGLTGAGLMLGALLWTMIDRFPGEAVIPSTAALETPMINLTLGVFLTIAGIAAVVAFAPRVVRKTGFEGADTLGSGRAMEAPANGETLSVGDTGEALTPLHPSGAALIGGRRVDVISEGRVVAKGAPVVVTRVEGMRVVVEPAAAAAPEAKA
ncbi:MAG: NfeD family protein [Verrucomicrobiota bacterium]